MNRKPTRQWTTISQEGEIHSLHATEQQAQQELCKGASANWEEYQQRGYKCIQITNDTHLQTIWEYCSKLYAQGEKHLIEGTKLWAEGEQLREKSDRSKDETLKSWMQGNRARILNTMKEEQVLTEMSIALKNNGEMQVQKGIKLREKAESVWEGAVASVYGKIKITNKWNDEMHKCILGNGKTFEHKK